MNGRGHFITESIELVTETCCNCGVLFAIPKRMQDNLRRSECSFFCPSGHTQHYCESEATKLKRELTASKCETVRERTAKELAESELRRHRLRSKVGVCPCCHRTFKQLSRHMATKHPTFKP